VSGGTTFEISTVTDAQFKAALAPTTVADQFAKDSQDAARYYHGTVRSGDGDGLQGFTVTGTEGALVAMEVAAHLPDGKSTLSIMYQSPSNAEAQCQGLFNIPKLLDEMDRLSGAIDDTCQGGP
jgi:hypothetical protein